MSRPDFSHRTATWLLGHPRACSLILAGVLLGSLATLPFVKIQSGTAPFTDPTRTPKLSLDRVNAQFGSDRLLLITCESDDLFSARVLQSLRRLGQDLRAMEVRVDGQVVKPIADVTSLTTVKDLVGADLNFKTVPLVPDPVPTDPAQLAHLRARALRLPLLRENVLSSDLRVTGMTVRLVDHASDDVEAVVVRHARARLAAEQRATPGVSYRVTGAVTLAIDTATYMAADLGRFIPFVYLIIIVLLYLFLRRVVGTLVVLANVTVCMVAGFAILTLLGGTINNLSTIMPPVVMVLAVASVLHFMAEVSKHARSLDRQAAYHATVRDLVGPVFMCALTTAVGFATISASTMPAYRDFGIAVSLTVMVSAVISFLLIAAVSRRLRPDQLVAPSGVLTSARFDWVLDAYTGFASRHAGKLVAVSAALFVLGMAGACWLRVDMNEVEQFGRHTPARQDVVFFERHLGGTSAMLIAIQAPHADDFLEPEALRRLDALGEFLRREVGADAVVSLADYVKAMHRAFLDEEQAQYRVPDTRAQAAQLMLLASDPQLAEVVDPANRWVRVVARFKDHSSATLRTRYDRVEAYLARQFPAAAGYRTDVTGNPQLWVDMVEQIVKSQTNSFGLSFLLIFIPIFLMFRSVRAGLFSIPSNLFPIGITFGLMGWLGINLDGSTAVIASIALGIAVDDTVHFIAYLRLRLREHGDVDRAMRETMHMKGIGALWTSLVLTLGFAITMASHFRPTRAFGLLAGLAIVLGVIGEFLLLPPLILLTRSRLGVPRPTPAAAAAAAGAGADAGADAPAAPPAPPAPPAAP